MRVSKDAGCIVAAKESFVDGLVEPVWRAVERVREGHGLSRAASASDVSGLAAGGTLPLGPEPNGVGKVRKYVRAPP